MNKRTARVTRAVVLGAGFALAAVSAAFAHHSFAMFDSEHQIKVSGKVTGFQWANPHVYIEMDGKNVKDDKAEARHYTVECASPGILTRIGWKFNMMKPGDEITVIIAPLRTGEPGGLLKLVTLADGRKFLIGWPSC
jgi:hypothetical protein